MDRFDCMRAFVETVRSHGFAAAARALELPRSTVSKQVRALEDAIGAQLLVRTTRSLRLTDVGSEYFEAAVELLASLDEAEQRARGGELRGVLRINAPVSFAQRRLAPLLPRFHALYPLLELQLVLSDFQEDPVRGGFDVTLRIANLPDSSLVARTLGPAPRLLVASPDYLRRAGVPQVPDDLAAHAVLGYCYQQSGTHLILTRGDEVGRVQARGPFHANNGDLLAQMAEAGMGITLLPTFIAADALAGGRLVQVMADWHAPPIGIHAIYPRQSRIPQKTRCFIDFLAAELLAPE